MVPLPPAVPGLPARRAPAVRSGAGRDVARARGGLVPGQRLPGHGRRAPPVDDRARAVCAARGRAGAGDLRRGADLDRPALDGRPRRPRDQGIPTTGRAGRLGHRPGRRDGRGPTLGGDRRRGVVRRGAEGRARVLRLVPGDAARDDVRRRARADDGRRRVRRGAGDPVEHVAGHRALVARRGAPARRRRRPGGGRASRRRRPSGWPSATRTRSSSARPSWRSSRWRTAGGTRRPIASGSRSASSRSTRCTTTPSACSPSRPQPVSPSTRVTSSEADRRLTRAMRARPACTFVLPFLAIRGRLQLAKVYTTRGDQAASRLLLREIDDVLRRRPLLGALVDEVAEFRRVASADGGRSPGLSPLTSAELRLLPYLQTYLDDRRDRRSAADHPQHGRHRGVRHLPQAGCLLAWRRRSPGHRARAARRLSPPTHARFPGGGTTCRLRGWRGQACVGWLARWRVSVRR